MRVAVVGATGMVGRVMLEVLAQRGFPVTELFPVASDRSAGQKVMFNGKSYSLLTLAQAVEKKPDIALFSAGGSVSLEWAPKFASVGTRVIDNSSAWRMEKEIPLVVPEINADAIKTTDNIIANPNCSTIQLLMVLSPLQKNYGLKRVVISTYQSITGTGMKAVEQFENERNGVKGEMVYPYHIDKNCLPHCDVFLENGYTKEEMKLMNETRKILNDSSIGVTATAVRVPVVGGHSESVNVELRKEATLQDIRKMLHDADGVVLQDNPELNVYPMPAFAHGKDEVFVGRIRKDESQENSFNFWIVADNLRKGAATNAVQIAEYLLKNQF
jgi:aspartate-semialdehyde dehydrogenase